MPLAPSLPRAMSRARAQCRARVSCCSSRSHDAMAALLRPFAPARRAYAGLCASRQLQALVEGGIAAHGGGHQEAIAFAEDALHVVGVDMGMADDHIVLLAGVDHPRHPFEHLGMLVLAGIAELLGEIALADEDGADAGHLAQDVGQR